MSETGQTTRRDIPHAVAELPAPKAAASVHADRDRPPRRDPEAPHHLDYNPDIDWLLNDAPALLGEHSVQASVAASIELGGGNHGTVHDNWPQIEAAHAAMRAVEKARELNEIWGRIDPRHQHVLRARYLRSQRKHWPSGCVLALGDLVGPALMLAKDSAALRWACTNKNEPGNAKIIERDTRTAQRAVRGAHKAWADTKRERAREWAEGAE